MEVKEFIYLFSQFNEEYIEKSYNEGDIHKNLQFNVFINMLYLNELYGNLIIEDICT